MGVGQKVASLYAELTLDDAKFQAGVKNAASGVGTLGTKVQKTGAQLRGFGSKLTQMSAPLALVGGYAVKTAIEWEDAFAGVRKTVEGTDEELRDLERGLRDLATSADSPVSALENAHFELASIAEAAGQLGVKTEHIVMFTEQMALLGVATNMTGEEASFMVAQLANVTGMDLETELQGFTAAIVWLGNNTATTEKDILALSQRIAGAGTAAGFAEPQIAGLAAAALSLGFAPERAGTNLSMWLYDIVRIVGENGPALDRFAEIAGMDTSGFKELWEADPQEGLVAFLEGLNELPDAEKFAALEEFGWTAGTLSPLLLALAGNTDLLTFAMDGATTAAEDGSAAYEEAGKRADTAKGSINKLKNNFNDLAIVVGEKALPPLVEFSDKLVPLIERLAETHPGVLKVALAFGALALVAGPLVYVVGALASVFSVLVSPIGLLAGTLTLGLLNNLKDFAGNLRDVRTAIEEGDLVGLLEGIVGALFDIPEGVAMAVLELAGVEDPKGGLAAWEGVVDNIKTIVKWIAKNAGKLLSGINFSIPAAIQTLWNLLSDIVGWLGEVSGIDGGTDVDDLELGAAEGNQGFPVWLEAPGPSSYFTGAGGTGYYPPSSKPNSSKIQSSAGFGGHDFVGPARKGQPYWIGTGAQPELFIPDSNGMMYPAGSYGGTSIQIGAVYVQDEDPARWLDRLEREASRRNLTLGVARG